MHYIPLNFGSFDKHCCRWSISSEVMLNVFLVSVIIAFTPLSSKSIVFLELYFFYFAWIFHFICYTKCLCFTVLSEILWLVPFKQMCKMVTLLCGIKFVYFLLAFTYYVNCRVPENRHGDCNWLCNYGIHWIFCEADPHSN